MGTKKVELKVSMTSGPPAGFHTITAYREASRRSAGRQV